jgi:hypothetical protein
MFVLKFLLYGRGSRVPNVRAHLDASRVEPEFESNSLINRTRVMAMNKILILLLIGAFVLFSAAVSGKRAWDRYHPGISNDGVTLIYAGFAGNLLRYPLSQTHGLMAELVGNPPQSMIAGERPTWYLDHPPGLVWLIALFGWSTAADPILAARLTSMIASIATGVAILAFICTRVGLLPAIGATVALLTLPLYWEHAVVGNFEPATLFFTLAAAISFVGYLRRPGSVRLAGTVALWIAGMSIDWPAYFLGGPMAAALAYRRRWGPLVLLAALGLGAMAVSLSLTGLSVIALWPSMLGSFPGGVPFGAAVEPATSLLMRGFAQWTWFLVLPFIAIAWRDAPSPQWKELRFIFLSFLFIGIANEVVFIQWAMHHSFWSYYLIPAVCFGVALVLQWLQDRNFEFAAARHALRASVALLFVACAGLSGREAIFSVRRHFDRPPTVADMLGAQHLQGLLDPRSTLLVGPYCRDANAIHRPGDKPDCRILVGPGSMARYVLDRPAIPVTDFDPSASGCENAYVILKGPDIGRKVSQLGLAASEIPMFGWHVLRLSELPSIYCDRPAQLFVDLSRNQ